MAFATGRDGATVRGFALARAGGAVGLRDVRRARAAFAEVEAGTPLGPVRALRGGPPEGAPAVLLHGLGVSSAYMLPLALRLAGRRPVLVPDMPGFGASAKPRALPPIGAIADALDAWSRALGLGEVHVVANSFGCQVATAWAVRRPARVRSLALLGPTVDARRRTLPRQAWRWLANAALEPPGMALLLARDLRRAGVRRTAQGAREAIADPHEARLPRIACPTLVVRGSRDLLAPAHWCRAMAAAIPGARMATVQGRAHALNYNAPDRTARLVEAFLASVGKRTSSDAAPKLPAA